MSSNWAVAHQSFQAELSSAHNLKDIESAAINGSEIAEIIGDWSLIKFRPMLDEIWIWSCIKFASEKGKLNWVKIKFISLK